MAWSADQPSSPAPAARPADRGRSIRPPAVAGTFYPADPDECGVAVRSLLRPNAGATGGPGAARRFRGAIVPHAGWICSGAIAGEAIATLADSGGGDDPRARPPDVVVVFGAIHTPLPVSA